VVKTKSIQKRESFYLLSNHIVSFIKILIPVIVFLFRFAD